MKITKSLIRSKLDLKTDTEIAEFFGTSKQAVGQWGPDDKAIPEGRQWQAKALRPDLFGPAPKRQKARAA